MLFALEPCLRDRAYEEECANNFVNDLIQACEAWQFHSFSMKVFAQGALAEDVNVATEDASPPQIEPSDASSGPDSHRFV